MSEPTPANPQGVLHLVDRDAPPIACATLRLLMSRLDPAACPQQVLALGDGGHLDWLARNGVPFEQVPLRGRAEPIRSLQLGRRLGRRLRADRPFPVGLLHAHSPRSAVCATVCGLIRPAVRRTPIAVEVYRRPGDRQLRWLASSLPRFDLRLLARSQELRRIVAAAGFGPERVGVLRPGLQLSQIRPGERDRVRGELGLAADDGPVLLASGWCRRPENQRLALWAAAILSMLTPNLRIVAPGDGPEQEFLRRWIGQAGYGANSLFPGRRFDWPQLLVAADVLVHASVDEADTTPIGWAMAAGVPVVAATSPGTVELIRDHETGLLCPPQQRELAIRIRRLLGDEPLRRRLIDLARHEACRQFKPSDAVAGYALFYAQALADSRSTGDAKLLA